MKRLAIAMMLASPAAAGAQSMPVATFLAKAEALEKKGALALFSSDVGLLKKEVQASGKLLRAEQQAAVRDGRKPAYCLPANAAVNSGELLAHLRALPQAERGQPIKTAFAGLMRRKYPCPA